MLASGHFYASGIFWAVAVVAVTIVFGVATIIIWRLGAPRRLIVYSMEVTSLLARAAPTRAVPALKVSYEDQVLADPNLIVLRVESRSRRDIASADFDAGKPLVFDVGARIAAPVGGPSSVIDTPAGMISLQDDKILLAPLLIRKGQLFRMELLTDGTPDLFCESPLIDVTVREGDTGQRRIDPGRTLVATAAAVAALSLIAATASTATGFWAGLAAVVATTVVGLAVVSGWWSKAQTGWRRRGQRPPGEP